jgi:heat shock protein HslJ
MKKFLFFSLAALALTGCKTTKTDQKTIIGQTWELQDINGVKALQSDFSNGMPTILFSADKGVSGTGGCNGYRGEYTLDSNGTLTVDKVMATKMYCEGVHENEFMAALSRAKKASVEDGNLILAEGDNKLLVFVPKEVK